MDFYIFLGLVLVVSVVSHVILSISYSTSQTDPDDSLEETKQKG